MSNNQTSATSSGIGQNTASFLRGVAAPNEINELGSSGPSLTILLCGEEIEMPISVASSKVKKFLDFSRATTMLLLPISLVILLSGSFFGQVNIEELKPNHSAELEVFLNGHKAYSFLSERSLESDYLEDMRRYFRKGMMPYYCFGDFNHDGREDFAVLLSREGSPRFREGAEHVFETHDPDYPLVLVVFDAKKGGGFKVAFTSEIYGPRAGFINYEVEKGKATLYYGVFETDSDTFELEAAKGGYIIKYPRSH